MNKTEQFLSRINELFQQEIPNHVIEKARLSLLDYIGVTLAGVTGLKDKLEAYLCNENLEVGDVSVIGMDCKLSLKDAVFLNGLNGHALDFDDGTNTGIIHLGSPIFSVLLPLAQRYRVSSEKFFKAVVIGYETSFTMAVSIQPKHKEMGYHATGTCGVLGIALAVSYMLDYTFEQTKNAFATACVSATGMLQVLDDGSELKPYNVAKSALLGLISTQIARAGFIGNPDPLGSFRGYLKMMVGDNELELKKPLLDGTYAIEKSYTKPYAACRYCHPAIEAAIRMKEKHGVMKDDVSSIQVSTYYWAVDKHDHTEIPSSASGKMSIPYGVAVGLIYGRAGLLEYDSYHIKNEDILKLTRKVCVYADDELTMLFPKITTAIVTLKTTLGECYTERVDYPKGEPENPLTEEEFNARFIELAVFGGKTKEVANAIIYSVKTMDGSMKRLFDYL